MIHVRRDGPRIGHYFVEVDHRVIGMVSQCAGGWRATGRSLEAPAVREHRDEAVAVLVAAHEKTS